MEEITYRVAFCYAGGQIRFGNSTPAGALLIATCLDAQTLLEAIEGTARQGYDNKTWLVPGIPEGSSQNEKLLALRDYRVRVGKILNLKMRKGGR